MFSDVADIPMSDIHIGRPLIEMHTNQTMQTQQLMGIAIRCAMITNLTLTLRTLTLKNTQ